MHGLDEAPEHHFLDLDRGNRQTLPDRLTGSLAAWLEGQGADLGVEFAGNGVALVSVGLVLNSVSEQKWNTLTPDSFPQDLQGDDPGDEVIERGGVRYHHYDGQPELPLTFAFQTRKGAQGLLQVTDYVDEPKGVKRCGYDSSAAPQNVST
ncbi:MAG: hypothetical protein ACLFVH_12375 [Phycisphaerae bacterium]